MRMVLALLLLALGILGSPNASRAQAQWIEYRPPGVGFRVELPGEPQRSEKDVPTKVGPIRMHMAAVPVGDDVVFMAIHSSYPPGVLSEDRQAVLDSGRNGGVANVKGKLRSEERITVGGMPGRKIVIDIPQGQQASVAIFVLSGDDLYQAVAVVPAGQEDSADVQRFINSFALVPR
jgi:hypothetical protein